MATSCSFLSTGDLGIHTQKDTSSQEEEGAQLMREVSSCGFELLCPTARDVATTRDLLTQRFQPSMEKIRVWQELPPTTQETRTVLALSAASITSVARPLQSAFVGVGWDRSSIVLAVCTTGGSAPKDVVAVSGLEGAVPRNGTLATLPAHSIVP
ncbi:unnamed protein product [Rangifer tarandus platyrhynchus]|uniref:Uncharacterized protein n=1 Tax=Rangifer tarandus platyrhynchus TaxID=3082113 RepID=A0AC59YE88_RANTA